MIRTALLAGIFLVLLSIAASRPGPGLLPSLKEEVASAKAAPVPPKHVAQAPAAEPAATPQPVHRQEAPPAPVIAEAAPAPALVPAAAPASVVVQEASQEARQEPHKSAGQPLSLLPPEMTHPQAAAAAPAPLLPVEPAASSAPATPPALTPAAEMPTIPVAPRPAVAPYDVPSGTAHVAVADPGAKPADAPKFMTPQERSKELYRLAREMEDTFIHKLAR